MALLPHILLVDDDLRLHQLVASFLERHQLVVTAVANAAAARTCLETLRFDLIILDVMMPGEDGLSLARHLADTNPAPVLMLSALGAPADRIAGLEQGAADYLPKPFEPKELLLRIKNLLKTSVPDSAPIPVGRCMFHPDTEALYLDGKKIPLSGSEQELLALLLRHPNRVLSRTEIVQGTSGSERTADVWINRLRAKIEEDPRHPIHLQTMRGKGYRLVLR